MPVRGWPTMKMGRVICWRATSGFFLRQSITPSRFGQRTHEIAVGDFDADRRQPRLVDEPVDEQLQGGLPAVVAEVVEAGLRARGGEKPVGGKPFLHGHLRS